MTPSDYEVGTVVYYNEFYDGLRHFLAQKHADGQWYIVNSETGFCEDGYPVEPPEDAIVVWRLDKDGFIFKGSVFE